MHEVHLSKKIRVRNFAPPGKGVPDSEEWDEGLHELVEVYLDRGGSPSSCLWVKPGTLFGFDSLSLFSLAADTNNGITINSPLR